MSLIGHQDLFALALRSCSAQPHWLAVLNDVTGFRVHQQYLLRGLDCHAYDEYDSRFRGASLYI